MTCLFCEIAAGRVPCEKIWEDDKALAFLDINPLAPGHALVIPRAHIETLAKIEDPLLAHLAAGVRRTAAALQTALQAEGINLLQNNGRVAGQVVPHFHFHVIPRKKGDGIAWNWRPAPYKTPEEMAAAATALRRAWRTQGKRI